jgi:hypothetical protein
VEKNQYELCVEVLARLHKAGILKDIILIGSWCVPFYKEYFSGVKYPSTIRTRDVDFLVPQPNSIKIKVNIPALLKDLGFVVGHAGSKGYVRLQHPDLVVEFLSPEKGKGIDKPIPLPQLGVNAVALRFLNLLADNVIKTRVKDFDVLLPHPANFALHKLIVSQRRFKEDKAIKDKDAAVETLKALLDKGEIDTIRAVFGSLPAKWQKKVLKALAEAREEAIVDKLS